MRLLTLFSILSLIIISFCVEEEEFPLDDEIRVLTEATFDKVISKYDNILVMFYMHHIVFIPKNSCLLSKKLPLFYVKRI